MEKKPDGKIEKGEEWWQLVSSFKMAGVADQSATFDPRGMDDDVDITFQRRGLKTLRNNGPFTLTKGGLWVWEIPMSMDHAKQIMAVDPRQDDRTPDLSHIHI